MTKSKISLISLGALSIIGASGFGIYKALNKENKSIPEKPLEIEKRLVIEEEPIQKKIEVKKEELSPLENVGPFQWQNIPKIEKVENKKNLFSKWIAPKKELIVYSIHDDEDNLEGLEKDDFGLRDLPDDTIGKKFSKYFISSKDDLLWDKHVEDWKITFNSLIYKENLADFRVRDKRSLTKDNLITKCRNAHKKTKWTDKVYSIKNIQDDRYWSMVWQLCGKGKELQPREWNPS